MSALETAVDAIITRVCEMEQLALAAQTIPSTEASKQWIYFGTSYPYWSNRPTRLTNDGENQYTLGIQGRLWLAHISQVNTGTEKIQVAAWGYLAAVIAYFEQYDNLHPPDAGALTYAEIVNLDPVGARISCPRGLDYLQTPLAPMEALYMDFDLTIPLLILG